MSTLEFPHFPPVSPLIRRHAEDAAFYWSQLDGSLRNMQLSAGRYAHFNQTLDAHLAGLRVAAEHGMGLAQQAMARWQGAGEAFVCAILAAQAEEDAARLQVVQQVTRDPLRSARGVISALAWLPLDLSMQWLAELSQARAGTCAQMLALRCVALRPALQPALRTPLAACLDDDSEFVRAAACRVAARIPQQAGLHAILRQASYDSELSVRAEAAIALFKYGGIESSSTLLQQCVSAQALMTVEASGWYQRQAERRLLRWLQHLACMLACGAGAVQRILQELPPRYALYFVLYHADPAHLGFVLQQLQQPELRRRAAWVWQSMTGIALQQQGLVAVADSADSAAALALPAADADLPEPDVAALLAHPINRSLRPGERIIGGQVLSWQHGFSILANGPQGLRNLSAGLFAYARPELAWPVRGPWQAQQQALHAAQASLGLRS